MGSFDMEAEDIDQRLSGFDMEVDIEEASASWERPAAPELRTVADSIGLLSLASQILSQQSSRSHTIYKRPRQKTVVRALTRR